MHLSTTEEALTDTALTEEALTDTPHTDEATLRIARLERRIAREREARREAEEIADRGMRELWLTNQSLDGRVAERTADLEKTLAALEAARLSRGRFLGNLSHEMRTPLNGVLGMLELLGPQVDDEQSKVYLETACRSADRLHQLLSRLLDLVDLDGGSLSTHCRAVDGSAFAEDLGNRWQRRGLATGHLLTVTSFLDDAPLFIDESRVSQIVDELLDNTTSHASPGAVRVSIRRHGDELEIAIEDSGPGIAPAMIEDLFSDFAMLDNSAARASEGLGVGLGLSQRMAQAMGGDLWLASDGTTSTQATLRIPSAMPKQADQPHEFIEEES